jgi:hypothetical protein
LLNRLTGTSRNGAMVYVGYDALGNITHKSDVGAYQYLRAHAVGQAGNTTYAYDANGNQTSGAGRTIAWTSRVGWASGFIVCSRGLATVKLVGKQ